VQTASGDGRKPGAAATTGDPAPHSDTDSDAFTKTGSVVFHNGKVDARFGRKVRITRPELLLAGEWDTLGIADPTVVLRISVDVTGNVTNVAVIQSSGTNDIDLPTQKAAFNWWFEPRKDGRGKPVPDVVLFTVRYR
jgi:TonB family protein